MPYREQIAEAERRRQQQAVARQNAAQQVRNLNSPQASVRDSAARSPSLGYQSPTRATTTTTTRSRNIQAEEAPETPRGPLNWRDAAYNAQIASIQRALADFETDATTRGERYGQDFTTGLGRLGYRPAEGFQAMPNVLEQLNQAQARTLSDGAQGGAPEVALPAVSGMFDIEGEFDPYSAAARGTRSTRDEFAGRGTLRSSDFAKTFGDFQNRLNQQLEAMETGRTRFGQDLATDVARERTRSQERQQAAQRDAMMRAAMAAASGRGF